MLGNGIDSFVVLPDTEAGAAVAERVPFEVSKVLQHPSGRPWVLARITFAVLTDVTIGDCALALVGPGPVERGRLRERLDRCAGLDDLGQLVAGEPGVFHAVARLGTRIRVQGTASGLRRVYFARVGAAVVASDRPAVLAQMADAAIDEAAVALRLLEPIPHPLADRVAWRGVNAVAPEHYLLLKGDRGVETRRWWTPPEPELPIETGAKLVQRALRDSVRLHIADRQRISSELSGGFDSTAVTCMAAQDATRPAGDSVVAVTAGSRDRLDDDGDWAALVAREQSGVEQHLVSGEQLPLVYADLARAGEYRLDEPSTAVANHARVLAVTEVARQCGSTVHLTGHGGDHLFVGLPTLCADLLRRHPVAAARRLRAYRGMFRWPLTEMLRQLLAPGTYRQWLRRWAIAGEGNDWQVPILTWGVRAVLPSWVTSAAREMISDEIRQAAQVAEPLAPTPGRHMELDGIRDGARMVRALADMTGQAGLPIAAPFFDDRVIEAAMRVRLQDRVQPLSYKPLLAQVIRGIVPDALLDRTTKGSGTLDAALGLRQHAPQLAELWRESLLAEHGLVDQTRLTHVCARPDTPELADGRLLSTVGCELWLRAHQGVIPPSTPKAT